MELIDEVALMPISIFYAILCIRRIVRSSICLTVSFFDTNDSIATVIPEFVGVSATNYSFPERKIALLETTSNASSGSSVV
jgi:hypothetical protein